MSTRAQNEKKFGQWDELADGGRRYRLDVRGRTLPNYNGFAYSWLEATGGLTLAWGDR